MSTALQDAFRKLPPRLQSIALPMGIALKVANIDAATRVLNMTTIATGVAPFESQPIFSDDVGSVVPADLGRIGGAPPQPYMLDIPGANQRNEAWIEIPATNGTWILTTPEIPCVDGGGQPLGSMTPQTIVVSIFI